MTIKKGSKYRIWFDGRPRVAEVQKITRTDRGVFVKLRIPVGILTAVREVYEVEHLVRMIEIHTEMLENLASPQEEQELTEIEIDA